MALVGNLLFCIDCGNLLDRMSLTVKTIQCSICDTSNTNKWPRSTTSVSKPSDFPSSLRNKLSSQVKQINFKDLQEGTMTNQRCPSCDHPEMSFTMAQLRGADEGSTIFYHCLKCDHSEDTNKIIKHPPDPGFHLIETQKRPWQSATEELVWQMFIYLTGSAYKTVIATVTVRSTQTIEPTTTYSTIGGAMIRAAVSRLAFVGKGPPIPISDYDLNYKLKSTAIDVCKAGYGDVYGGGTPTPATWSAIPKKIGFFSTITSYSKSYSDCVYTNPAAPQKGDGGSLTCAGTHWNCDVSTKPVLTCNPDALGGADTSIKPLIQCLVYGKTTSVHTIKKTITITKTSKIG